MQVLINAGNKQGQNATQGAAMEAGPGGGSVTCVHVLTVKVYNLVGAIPTVICEAG